MSARASTPKAARARARRGDHLAGASLGLAYVIALVATAGQLGLSRDESFYVTASEAYARWIAQLFAHPAAALTRQSIDAAFVQNHEHPVLMKLAFALSWLAHQKLQLGSDSLAFRLPGILAAGALVWLVCVFGARAFGRAVGVFAALALALMPRVFYHAHLDAFDVPIVCMVTLTTYAYWRALVSRRWAVMTGVCFGLALATKHNAWMLPGVFAVHFAFVAAGELRRRRRRRARRLSLAPWWLLTMLTLGPLIFVAHWPWLWHDTWPRIVAYAEFHLHHAYYNIEYFGVNYFWPPFPVSFPFVMTAITVPGTVLLLALLALCGRARALWPAGLAERLWPHGRLHADARCTDVLLLGSLLAPMVAIALPSTPIFGATKHWMPAYPFLALYAGLGFRQVWRASERWLARRHGVLQG